MNSFNGLFNGSLNLKKTQLLLNNTEYITTFFAEGIAIGVGNTFCQQFWYRPFILDIQFFFILFVLSF